MTEKLPDPARSQKQAARKGVSKAAFRRLPHYHQIVSAYEGLGRRYISSKELSQILDINETLVRKDMADLEIRGRQNQGYAIGTMKRTIEDFLGLQEITDALIIGAGHLGKALALYHGFEPYGLRIAGILDNDPAKIGSYVGPHEVLSVFRLASTIERKKIRLIVLTVPRPSAQEVTDIAVGAGVRAIWNFTPTELHVPDTVHVRNEQIIAGFMTLSYFLKNIGVVDEGAESAE